MRWAARPTIALCRAVRTIRRDRPICLIPGCSFDGVEKMLTGVRLQPLMPIDERATLRRHRRFPD